MEYPVPVLQPPVKWTDVFPSTYPTHLPACSLPMPGLFLGACLAQALVVSPLACSDVRPLGTCPLPGQCHGLVFSTACVCPAGDAQCDRGRWDSRSWVLILTGLLEGRPSLGILTCSLPSTNSYMAMFVFLWAATKCYAHLQSRGQAEPSIVLPASFKPTFPPAVVAIVGC